MARKRRTVVDAVISMMEDPVSMSNEYGGSETAMAPTFDDQLPDVEMDYEEDQCGFTPEDYQLARELVSQVGSVERARELLENLEEVTDTLDLEPGLAAASGYDVDDIADQMPEDPDLPTNMLGMSSLYDAGHSGHM